jgi:glycosyltransferase involved in cell wall biosynthesis
MCDSIHFARWVSSIDFSKYQIRLVSSSPHRRIHPLLRNVLDSNKQKGDASIGFISRYFSLVLWLLDRRWIFSDHLRSSIVAHEVKTFKPDVVHAFETQNAGYLMLQSLNEIRKLGAKTVLSLYGSDLSWFSKIPHHLNKIATLLPAVDALHYECSRDAKLAKSFGFRGHLLPQSPAAPSIANALSIEANRERPYILVKGYQNKWGRGANLIRAIHEVRNLLGDKKIIVISAESNVPRIARKLLRKEGIEVQVYKKNTLSHEQVLEFLSKSEIYMAASMSDGLPATFIEAMYCGAFPIQTASSCVGEWAKDGQNTFLIQDPNSVAEIANKLKKALRDDDLSAKARQANFELAKQIYALAPRDSFANQVYQAVGDLKPTNA